jgi:hypothetical protein
LCRRTRLKRGRPRLPCSPSSSSRPITLAEARTGIPAMPMTRWAALAAPKQATVVCEFSAAIQEALISQFTASKVGFFF